MIQSIPLETLLKKMIQAWESEAVELDAYFSLLKEMLESAPTSPVTTPDISPISRPTKLGPTIRHKIEAGNIDGEHNVSGASFD